MTTSEIDSIRQRLRDLPDLGAASADRSPNVEEMFAPSAHAGALDPERALVVGGRGVGKSFWSSVLNDTDARNAAAEYYPKLSLDALSVSLGFHENNKGSDGIAPTRRALSRAIEEFDPLEIWRAVLVRALIRDEKIRAEQRSFQDMLSYVVNNSDEVDDLLVKADNRLARAGQRFLLVFDALDRLAADWQSITKLTYGIAQLALDLRGFAAIRAKLFMRRDQFDNGEALRFRDASKITNNRVELFWSKDDLFGWLFQWLWRGDVRYFRQIVCNTLALAPNRRNMPESLAHDESAQRAVFAALAGPYMGADRRRGMTDRKIVNSIADAHGEASLRSFSAAIKTAAEDAWRRGIRGRTLDHLALNAGIVRASSIRLEELTEDHGWIKLALEPLSGLTVPCPIAEIENRWKLKKTVTEIVDLHVREDRGPSTPISFTRGPNHRSLFDALEDVGVIEIRKDGRINVPDLFRVAAGMGRMGGVKSARTRN